MAASFSAVACGGLLGFEELSDWPSPDASTSDGETPSQDGSPKPNDAEAGAASDPDSCAGIRLCWQFRSAAELTEWPWQINGDVSTDPDRGLLVHANTPADDEFEYDEASVRLQLQGSEELSSTTRIRFSVDVEVLERTGDDDVDLFARTWLDASSSHLVFMLYERERHWFAVLSRTPSVNMPELELALDVGPRAEVGQRRQLAIEIEGGTQARVVEAGQVLAQGTVPSGPPIPKAVNSIVFLLQPLPGNEVRFSCRRLALEAY